MNTETALTILIGRSELAPFTATGHGSANQCTRGIVDGHMVEVNRRGDQVRVSIDGDPRMFNRDVAYDILTGAIEIDSAEVEYFHGA